MAEASTKTGSNGRAAQALPLIATKFFIPPPRPGLVSRPRLLQQLNEGLTRKLILISAPAGFGKTTLLSEWRLSASASQLPFAWLSLDGSDNDPARFWGYLITALQTIRGGVGKDVLAAFQLPQLPSAESVLPLLINDLAAIAQDFCLVLDDYHLITAEAIHYGLTFLLRHLPHQMHLVIASRNEPPLPLTLLRGRGQLTELGPGDLRFTAQEGAEFLQRAMGLSLTSEQVAVLEQRTEGWIAGLQMAAVSLQGRADVAEFVEAFSGSHRHVLDYLAEQALQRQPEAIQTFLLHTSILNRLCASLCDAVTEQPGGQAMLERLEQANLFLVPMDDERHWYRYHPLFADVLRTRLQQIQPDVMSDLHLRAAQWYDEHDLVEGAVQHALATKDYVVAARIVEQIYDRLGFLLGAKRLAWIRALPEEVVSARPHLCIALGIDLAWSLQRAAAEVWFDKAERLLRAHDERRTEASVDLRDQWADLFGYRMVNAGLQGDVEQIEPLAQQALDRYPDDANWRHLISAYLGRAYTQIMDYATAERHLAPSVPHLPMHEDLRLIEFAGLLAGAQREQGHLRQAAETYRGNLQLTSRLEGARPSSWAIVQHLGLAAIHYEWNDLDAATQHVQQVLTIAHQWESAIPLSLAYTMRAEVSQAQGDAVRAAEVLEQAQRLRPRILKELYNDGILRVLQARWACLDLWQGGAEAVRRWAQAVMLNPTDLEHSWQRVHQYAMHYKRHEHLVLARWFIAQGKAADALQLLEER